MKRCYLRVAIFNLLIAFALLGFGAFHGATAGVDPLATQSPTPTSPALHLVAITPSDTAEIPVFGKGILIGGAGDLVAIGAGDGTTESGASTANAATLTVKPVGIVNLPAYSSAQPGQYILCNDGTHATEIISGYVTGGTTLTVTTGGGTGGNTTANAHNDGTLIAAYAPLKSLNAGSVVPVRARRVMSTNTTATNLVNLY